MPPIRCRLKNYPQITQISLTIKRKGNGFITRSLHHPFKVECDPVATAPGSDVDVL